MITRTLLFSALLFQAGIASAVIPPGPEVSRAPQRTVQPAGDDMLKATPFRYTKKPKTTPAPAARISN